jgi:hypothetical protein
MVVNMTLWLRKDNFYTKNPDTSLSNSVSFVEAGKNENTHLRDIRFIQDEKNILLIIDPTYDKLDITK